MAEFRGLERFKSLTAGAKGYDNAIQCGVCLGKFHVWSSGKLDCTHTFCHICLLKLLKVSTRDRERRCCPLCRQPITNVWKTGIGSTLFGLRQHVKCLSCDRKDVPKADALYCNICGLSICPSCVDKHRTCGASSTAESELEGEVAAPESANGDELPGTAAQGPSSVDTGKVEPKVGTEPGDPGSSTEPVEPLPVPANVVHFDPRQALALYLDICKRKDKFIESAVEVEKAKTVKLKEFLMSPDFQDSLFEQMKKQFAETVNEAVDYRFENYKIVTGEMVEMDEETGENPEKELNESQVLTQLFADVLSEDYEGEKAAQNSPVKDGKSTGNGDPQLSKDAMGASTACDKPGETGVQSTQSANPMILNILDTATTAEMELAYTNAQKSLLRNILPFSTAVVFRDGDSSGRDQSFNNVASLFDLTDKPRDRLIKRISKDIATRLHSDIRHIVKYNVFEPYYMQSEEWDKDSEPENEENEEGAKENEIEAPAQITDGQEAQTTGAPTEPGTPVDPPAEGTQHIPEPEPMDTSPPLNVPGGPTPTADTQSTPGTEHQGTPNTEIQATPVPENQGEGVTAPDAGSAASTASITEPDSTGTDGEVPPPEQQPNGEVTSVTASGSERDSNEDGGIFEVSTTEDLVVTLKVTAMAYLGHSRQILIATSGPRFFLSNLGVKEFGRCISLAGFETAAGDSTIFDSVSASGKTLYGYSAAQSTITIFSMGTWSRQLTVKLPGSVRRVKKIEATMLNLFVLTSHELLRIKLSHILDCEPTPEGPAILDDGFIERCFTTGRGSGFTTKTGSFRDFTVIPARKLVAVTESPFSDMQEENSDESSSDEDDGYYDVFGESRGSGQKANKVHYLDLVTLEKKETEIEMFKSSNHYRNRCYRHQQLLVSCAAGRHLILANFLDYDEMRAYDLETKKQEGYFGLNSPPVQLVGTPGYIYALTGRDENNIYMVKLKEGDTKKEEEQIEYEPGEKPSDAARLWE